MNEVKVTEFKEPEGCSEFHYLLYPPERVSTFHMIGEQEGTTGHMPVCKYKQDGKSFVTFACYGTIEHPVRDMQFLTLVPNKLFDSKGYDDYKLVTTQEDLDKFYTLLADSFKEMSTGLFIDQSEPIARNGVFDKEEFEKCVKNPYYFYTTYVTINGKPATTMQSEEEFNKEFKSWES